jgi:hypothetical protein
MNCYNLANGRAICIAPSSKIGCWIHRHYHPRHLTLLLPPLAASKAADGGGFRSNNSSSFSSDADLASLRAELDVAKQQAAAGAQLRAEVDARTAAMANLQAQLEQVEALRAEELKSAVARFEELENALSLAENSMKTADTDEVHGAKDAEMRKHIETLEGKISHLSSELEAAVRASDSLREQLQAAKHAEKQAVDAAHVAQQHVAAAKNLAAEEAAKSAALLEKAEALAVAISERLHKTTSPNAVSTTTDTLSETDAEALLDELDLLRGELEAELLATEEEADRADAAENEAAALRQQLAALASAGDDGATTMGGFSQSLVQELAAARNAAASAAAEAEALRVTVAGLETQLETAQAKANSASSSRGPTLGFNVGGNGASAALSEALERIKELESEALDREAALAEGRTFLATVLEQQREQAKNAAAGVSSIKN